MSNPPVKKGTITNKLLSMVLLQVRWMEKRKWAVVRIRVREIAEQKGMSRTKLSRLSDTNYKTVDMIWKNPYKEVGTLTLERIAKALGVRVVDLIEETDN